MRALRNCDFCGDQAVGTFEIIPDELDPTEAERRRVVLCDSCKDTLQTLIEPLIERAGRNADRQRSPENGESSATGDETDTGEDRTNDLIESSSDEDGSLLGETDDASPEGSAPEDSDPEGTEDDGERSSDESDASSQTAQSSESVKNDRPDNYGQVLRLLRNREFPMTREEVVAIATSAYQLDARNVEAIIDEAIDRGEFAEADGRLQHA